MEPKYFHIVKDDRKIFFRVYIEKKFACSDHFSDYFDYYVTISDEYKIDFGLFLVVDDYQNIKMYNTVNKEYFEFEVDDLNMVHYSYEKLYFSDINLKDLVKEILYHKFVGYGIDV